MKTYQIELVRQTEETMKHNKELMSQNALLLQTQNELQTANQSLRASIKTLQSEQDLPQPRSMTTRDEQELLGLISSKDELIEKLEEQILKIREDLNVLNSLS